MLTLTELVKHYQRVELLMRKEDSIIISNAITIQKKPKQEWGLNDEIPFLLNASKIKNRYENYRKLIDKLNSTEKNIFYSLCQLNPSDQTQIERIHNAWEERSYFASLSSELLITGQKLI